MSFAFLRHKHSVVNGHNKHCAKLRTREITRLDLMAYLDPASKGLVLKVAKVPLQISFKQSKPFLAFLANC